MKMRRRTQARMLALQALCLFDALGEEFRSALGEFLADSQNAVDLGFEDVPDDETRGYSRRLAEGAWGFHDQADQLLRRHVTGWTIERMPPVDRNLLRLGLFELLELPDTPHQVVINEAVEIAKAFGGEDSTRFVNGVLDGIRKEVMGDAGPPKEVVDEPAT